MGQKSASCSASLCKQRAERGRAVAVAVGLLCLCLLLVCERCLRCILSSGRILPSAGMDDRCDGGEVRPTRPPGKSGGKIPLPIYSERRPNQYMQGFVGERCLEPGNPNRRSPKISDPRVGPPESDRCSVACSFQPATACDRSGARGGFCRRRGRTIDATADGSAPDARSTYAVLACAFACTTSQ